MARTILTAPLDYYVRPDGSDSNSGLVNSSSGAKLTPNAAMADLLSNYDGCGFVTVHHTGPSFPLTITDPAQMLKLITGQQFLGGTPTYQGNPADPTQVILAPSVFTQACIQLDFQTRLSVSGFTLQGNAMNGIYAGGAAQVMVAGPMIYGAVTDFDIAVNSQAGVYLNGGYERINGNKKGHFYIENAGFVENGSEVDMYLDGNPVWDNAFIYCIFDGIACLSPTYSVKAGSAAGAKVNIQFGGKVNTSGIGGANLPGSYLGTVADSSLGVNGRDVGALY